MNEWTDAAERVAAGQELPNGEITDLYAQGTVLQVRNDSGYDRAQFGVMKLGSPVITPTANENEFRMSPIFSVTKTDNQLNKIVILIEPIADGKVGEAFFAGVSICKVNVIDTNDGYVMPDSAGHNHFHSRGQGGAHGEILWKEAGTGEKWALVRIDTPAPGFWAKVGGIGTYGNAATGVVSDWAEYEESASGMVIVSGGRSGDSANLLVEVNKVRIPEGQFVWVERWFNAAGETYYFTEYHDGTWILINGEGDYGDEDTGKYSDWDEVVENATGDFDVVTGGLSGDVDNLVQTANGDTLADGTYVWCPRWKTIGGVRYYYTDHSAGGQQGFWIVIDALIGTDDQDDGEYRSWDEYEKNEGVLSIKTGGRAGSATHQLIEVNKRNIPTDVPVWVHEWDTGTDGEDEVTFYYCEAPARAGFWVRVDETVDADGACTDWVEITDPHTLAVRTNGLTGDATHILRIEMPFVPWGNVDPAHNAIVFVNSYEKIGSNYNYYTDYTYGNRGTWENVKNIHINPRVSDGLTLDIEVDPTPGGTDGWLRGVSLTEWENLLGDEFRLHSLAYYITHGSEGHETEISWDAHAYIDVDINGSGSCGCCEG